MKKILSIVIVFVMLLSLVSCSGTKNEESSSNNAVESNTANTEQENEVERDLPEGDYEEIGEGSFYLTGPSGSTENGDEMILYPQNDSHPHAFIGIELWDMDGSVETFIYVDGVKMLQHQVGAGFQGSIDFDDDAMWALTDGQHNVEAVQYADNDVTKEMTFYRAVMYTVKNN